MKYIFDYFLTTNYFSLNIDDIEKIVNKISKRCGYLITSNKYLKLENKNYFILF